MDLNRGSALKKESWKFRKKKFIFDRSSILKESVMEVLKEEVSKVHLQIKEFASEGKGIVEEKEKEAAVFEEAALQ